MILFSKKKITILLGSLFFLGLRMGRHTFFCLIFLDVDST